MFLQINLYRMEHGLPYLPESASVCEIAQKRVAEIQKEFKHKFHAEDFIDTEMRIYENLGRSNKDNLIENNQIVFEMWKQSPNHNANLLRDLDTICIRTNGKYYTLEAINYGKRNSPD